MIDNGTAGGIMLDGSEEDRKSIETEPAEKQMVERHRNNNRDVHMMIHDNGRRMGSQENIYDMRRLIRKLEMETHEKAATTTESAGLNSEQEKTNNIFFISGNSSHTRQQDQAHTNNNSERSVQSSIDQDGLDSNAQEVDVVYEGTPHKLTNQLLWDSSFDQHKTDNSQLVKEQEGVNLPTDTAEGFNSDSKLYYTHSEDSHTRQDQDSIPSSSQHPSSIHDFALSPRLAAPHPVHPVSPTFSRFSHLSVPANLSPISPSLLSSSANTPTTSPSTTSHTFYRDDPLREVTAEEYSKFVGQGLRNHKYWMDMYGNPSTLPPMAWCQHINAGSSSRGVPMMIVAVPADVTKSYNQPKIKANHHSTIHYNPFAPPASRQTVTMPEATWEGGGKNCLSQLRREMLRPLRSEKKVDAWVGSSEMGGCGGYMVETDNHRIYMNVFRPPGPANDVIVSCLCPRFNLDAPCKPSARWEAHSIAKAGWMDKDGETDDPEEEEERDEERETKVDEKKKREGREDVPEAVMGMAGGYTIGSDGTAGTDSDISIHRSEERLLMEGHVYGLDVHVWPHTCVAICSRKVAEDGCVQPLLVNGCPVSDDVDFRIHTQLYGSFSNPSSTTPPSVKLTRNSIVFSMVKPVFGEDMLNHSHSKPITIRCSMTTFKKTKPSLNTLCSGYRQQEAYTWGSKVFKMPSHIQQKTATSYPTATIALHSRRLQSNKPATRSRRKGTASNKGVGDIQRYKAYMGEESGSGETANVPNRIFRSGDDQCSMARLVSAVEMDYMMTDSHDKLCGTSIGGYVPSVIDGKDDEAKNNREDRDDVSGRQKTSDRQSREKDNSGIKSRDEAVDRGGRETLSSALDRVGSVKRKLRVPGTNVSSQEMKKATMMQMTRWKNMRGEEMIRSHMDHVSDKEKANPTSYRFGPITKQGKYEYQQAYNELMRQRIDTGRYQHINTQVAVDSPIDSTTAISHHPLSTHGQYQPQHTRPREQRDAYRIPVDPREELYGTQASMDDNNLYGNSFLQPQGRPGRYNGMTYNDERAIQRVSNEIVWDRWATQWSRNPNSRSTEVQVGNDLGFLGIGGDLDNRAALINTGWGDWVVSASSSERDQEVGVGVVKGNYGVNIDRANRDRATSVEVVARGTEAATLIDLTDRDYGQRIKVRNLEIAVRHDFDEFAKQDEYELATAVSVFYKGVAISAESDVVDTEYGVSLGVRGYQVSVMRDFNERQTELQGNFGNGWQGVLEADYIDPFDDELFMRVGLGKVGRAYVSAGAGIGDDGFPQGTAEVQLQDVGLGVDVVDNRGNRVMLYSLTVGRFTYVWESKILPDNIAMPVVLGIDAYQVMKFLPFNFGG
eukprot:GHVQ01003555.1.p1 GENE.GHVQ01003555.1~~GHVQ01003555.1.p1  ORF type:complete len:1345 (+),score=263.58 GHVQ01003555.1:696-4730(+)